MTRSRPRPPAASRAAADADGLAIYRARRDFRTTPEPRGRPQRRSAALKFVVQHHSARRDHYDFRLEHNGALLSWAVPRGPSANPRTRRLAVRTEDHPLEYAEFEGVIPNGAYGAGPVLIWDRGDWFPLSGDVDDALAAGEIKFRLNGERMHGDWTLIRLSDNTRENWLLMKKRDAWAEDDDTLAERFPTSARSGLKFAEIEAGKPSAPVNAKSKSERPAAFVPLMLCQSAKSAPETPDWFYEMKYDGYRLEIAIAGPLCKVFTRNGHDWGSKFANIAAAAGRLNLKNSVLDGEAVVLDENGVSNFPRLVDDLKTGGREIVFIIFDILRHGGEDVRSKTLSERKKILEKALRGKITESGVLRLAPWTEEKPATLLSKIASAGGEGIIAKKRSSKYRGERSPSWLKIKIRNREDVVIVGYLPSTRGRAFASLLAGVREKDRLRYVGRIGTGFDDAALEHAIGDLDPLRLAARPETVSGAAGIPKNVVWVEPSKTAAIAYGGWTGDGKLRAASFLGWREDVAVPLKSVAKRRGAQGGEMKNPVAITHADRIVYRKAKFSKGDIAEYYARVAPRMLPHLAERPVSLLRAPDGIDKGLFFQRHPSPAMKRGIERISDPKHQHQPYMVIAGAEGLQTAVQFGTVEFHGWMSTRRDLSRPDRVIFDLDPSDDVSFKEVAKAAELVRDILKSASLKSYALVSGGKGVHVIAPLDRSRSMDDVELFAKGIARRLAQLEPERFVATATKARRKNRIFIDWLRNKFSSTAVVPYSLRAKDTPSIAMPVTWRDLSAVRSASAFQATSSFLSRRDPWPDFFKIKQNIGAGILDQFRI